MKAVIIADQKRYEKFNPHTVFADAVEKVYVTPNGTDTVIPPEAADAEFVAIDAVAMLNEAMMDKMPNLKIIHSEGVGYNGIDCEAAARRGIYVCNNHGINSDAVAEQAVMLMIGVLRDVVNGDKAVREGKQMETKLRRMVEGIKELGECKVGLIGFGNIAKATAKRLVPFGCEVYYNDVIKAAPEQEKEYQVTYKEIPDILAECDMISLHVPVLDSTVGMVNEAFLRKMRPDAYLINTARGELLDNDAFMKAMTEGWIAGAGFDTIAPEPVPADHPFFSLPEEAQKKIIYAPHLGGITTGMFKKGHMNIWNAFEAVSRKERPDHIVNGL